MLDSDSDTELDEQTDKNIDNLINERQRLQRKQMRAKSIMLKRKGLNIQMGSKKIPGKVAATNSSNIINAKKATNEIFHKIKAQASDYWSSVKNVNP